MRVIRRKPPRAGKGVLRDFVRSQELRASGPVADEDLARVSPLLRSHVIPNGSYDLSVH